VCEMRLPLRMLLALGVGEWRLQSHHHCRRPCAEARHFAQIKNKRKKKNQEPTTDATTAPPASTTILEKSRSVHSLSLPLTPQNTQPTPSIIETMTSAEESKEPHPEASLTTGKYHNLFLVTFYMNSTCGV